MPRDFVRHLNIFQIASYKDTPYLQSLITAIQSIESIQYAILTIAYNRHSINRVNTIRQSSLNQSSQYIIRYLILTNRSFDVGRDLVTNGCLVTSFGISIYFKLRVTKIHHTYNRL